MNPRENMLALMKRKGFEHIPVEFMLCPSLVEAFKAYTKSVLPYEEHYEFPMGHVGGLPHAPQDPSLLKTYFPETLHPDTCFDSWGVAHEPGSAAAMHMTRMHHPLEQVQGLDNLMAYPFPQFEDTNAEQRAAQVRALHRRGLAAVGAMQCTIWETAWYMRSMNELMMDMMTEDPKAEYLLDTVTDAAVKRAEAFARAGVDILYLGDDIGMQSTIMMRDSLYCTWIKPRLKKVIDAAKAIYSDIIIFYHTCGYVKPLIPHLIEVGIDVLNPVQPECMDFEEIHELYGEQLSFHGTLGTQTTMPFGTPEEVRRMVFRNLDIAGKKGGLLIAPTHVLEPEVPWENVLAYVQACRSCLPRTNCAVCCRPSGFSSAGSTFPAHRAAGMH